MGTKKLPSGVSTRKDRNSIRISFQYQGVQCQETLKGLKANKSGDIKYASQLKAEIDRKISLGSFHYADYFPSSPKLKLFGAMRSDSTVKDYLAHYIDINTKRGLATSTIRGYEIAARRLSLLHPLTLINLSVNHLKQFITDKCLNTGKPLTAKTIRNTLSVLNGAIQLAVNDGTLKENICANFNWTLLVQRSQATRERTVDPFTLTEIDAILDHQRSQEGRNTIEFMFFTGLRQSEMNGLMWENVDLEQGSIEIKQAIVYGEVKQTKTNKGQRFIDLEPRALSAIQNQLNHTGDESKYVFLDVKTRRPYKNDEALRKKLWVPILELAGVRYRKPYNMRHTYACMMISDNRNTFWVADQMGHEDPTMLFRHYGSYLKDHDKKEN